MHIPLADGPQDGIRRDSKTAIPLSDSEVKERQAGVSGGGILKTTTIDTEQGLGGW